MKALIVGINNYPGTNKLVGCVEEAEKIETLLSSNEDGSKNFDVELIRDIESASALEEKIEKLFTSEKETALFYFSGHGTHTHQLVTADLGNDKYISLEKLTCIITNSKTKNKIIILDACYSGHVGTYKSLNDISILKDGVTIMTACRSVEPAGLNNNGSYFTSAFISAIEGAAADFRGRVTLNSVYNYIDTFFGENDQRPVFKTNTTAPFVIRTVKPRVDIETIKASLKLFSNENSEFALDPSFEKTNYADSEHYHKEPYCSTDNVHRLENLQKMESIGLCRPTRYQHMYEEAMKSGSCCLTTEGKFVWKLNQRGRL